MVSKFGSREKKFPSPSSFKNKEIQNQVKQNKSTPIVNPDSPQSPYYLHSSKNLSNIISLVILTRENYEYWSRAMVNTLKSKNKLGFCEWENWQT